MAFSTRLETTWTTRARSASAGRLVGTFQAHPVAAGLALHALADLVEHGCQVELRRLHEHLAALQAGEVQDVLDQAHQLSRSGVDAVGGRLHGRACPWRGPASPATGSSRR